MPSMRMALILRGHARTWRWSLPATVRSLQSCAVHIDAYLCLWGSSSFGTDQLAQMADLLPTVCAELVDHSHWDLQDACDGYTAPSWQAARSAKALRRQAAVAGSYDLIIDTRPDIYITADPSQLCRPPSGQVQSTLIADPWPSSHLPGMEDHLLVMDQHTHDIWCQRHYQRYDIAYNHCILQQYCSDHGLTTAEIPWLRSSFVRPNWPAGNHHSLQHHSLRQALGQWNDMETRARLEHCISAGIDPREYSAPFHVGDIAFQHA